MQKLLDTQINTAQGASAQVSTCSHDGGCRAHLYNTGACDSQAESNTSEDHCTTRRNNDRNYPRAPCWWHSRQNARRGLPDSYARSMEVACTMVSVLKSARLFDCWFRASQPFPEPLRKFQKTIRAFQDPRGSVRDTFRAWDQDKDGFLSYTEFKNGLERIDPRSKVAPFIEEVC